VKESNLQPTDYETAGGPDAYQSRPTQTIRFTGFARAGLGLIGQGWPRFSENSRTVLVTLSAVGHRLRSRPVSRPNRGYALPRPRTPSAAITRLLASSCIQRRPGCLREPSAQDHRDVPPARRSAGWPGAGRNCPGRAGSRALEESGTGGAAHRNPRRLGCASAPIVGWMAEPSPRWRRRPGDAPPASGCPSSARCRI
jgi:hypothetical protein